MAPDVAARVAALAVDVFEDEHPLTAAMRQRLTDRITARLMVEPAPVVWSPEAPTLTDPRSL